MEIKKNIIILAPSTLPIPAVESGAYEHLIELIIDENELDYKVNFIVISLENAKTRKLRVKYKNTKFIDFRNSFLLRALNKIYKYKYFLSRKKNWYNFHITQITGIIKNTRFDKIIIFGGVHHIKPISECVEKNKIIFFLGTEILENAHDFSLCHKVLLGNKRLISKINEINIELASTKLVNLVPGIDINYYENFNHEKSLNLKEKFNIDIDTTVITYVGRVINSKGVSILLNSCLKLHKSNKFKIILIGSLGSNFGSDGSKLKQTDTEGIPELLEKLGSKCISTGFVNVGDLPDYLALTDIGVVPSICEDVAPGSYLQFLCLGKATVVSDAGGIPEFFSDDYSLMFKRGENMEVELANHLEFLIKNSEVRMKMGKEALRMRTTLSKERYYIDLVDLVLN
jgi:glycosyltransferase involved in cell wall biosynthesis